MPESSMIVIGGKNDQGKTSLLNAIEFALAGGRSICEQPIRRGKKKARIVLDLEDLKITRTFTEGGGGTLTVRGRDGELIGSPQTLLDRLFNKLTFDPLVFMRLGKAAKTNLLMDLVGLDFGPINARETQLIEDRKDRGRDVKASARSVESQEQDLRQRMEKLGINVVPDEPTSVDEVQTEYDKAIAQNEANEAKRVQYQDLRNNYKSAQGEEDTAIDSVASLEKRLAAAKQELAEATSRKKDIAAQGFRMKKKIDALVDVDVKGFMTQFATVSGVNEAIACRDKLLSLQEEHAVFESKRDELNGELANIPGEKAAMIASAEMPIEGLGFVDGLVTFDGTLFEQCGTAVQIRVSVAMGVAMNPDLCVFLLRRDGSLLDEENLVMLGELADENDAQLWVERVSVGAECQVIIQDGQIVAAVA